LAALAVSKVVLFSVRYPVVSAHVFEASCPRPLCNFVSLFLNMRLMYHDAVQGLAFGVYTDAFVAMVVKCIVLVREVTGARFRPCITNAITTTPANYPQLSRGPSLTNGLAWLDVWMCVSCADCGRRGCHHLYRRYHSGLHGTRDIASLCI
jgi:hypothetical protein